MEDELQNSPSILIPESPERPDVHSSENPRLWHVNQLSETYTPAEDEENARALDVNDIHQNYLDDATQASQSQLVEPTNQPQILQPWTPSAHLYNHSAEDNNDQHQSESSNQSETTNQPANVPWRPVIGQYDDTSRHSSVSEDNRDPYVNNEDDRVTVSENSNRINENSTDSVFVNEGSRNSDYLATRNFNIIYFGNVGSRNSGVINENSSNSVILREESRNFSTSNENTRDSDTVNERNPDQVDGDRRNSVSREEPSSSQKSAKSTEEDDVEPPTKVRKLDTSVQDDGETCPICLESWGNSGAHRLVALACGHLFGAQCVQRWLGAQRPRERTCPTCKSKAALKDVRCIYARRLVAADMAQVAALQQQLAALQAGKMCTTCSKAALKDVRCIYARRLVAADMAQVAALQQQLAALQAGKMCTTCSKAALKDVRCIYARRLVAADMAQVAALQQQLAALQAGKMCTTCSKAALKDVRCIYARRLVAADMAQVAALQQQLAALQAGKMCTTCSKAALKDVRCIYARRLVVADMAQVAALQQQLAALQAEKNRSELELQKTRYAHRACMMQLEGLRKTLLKTQVKEQPKRKSWRFALEKNLEVNKDGGCRVMTYNCRTYELCVSQKSNNYLFPGYGIRRVSCVDYKPGQFLHLHPKPIRDITYSQPRDLLLSVGLDNTARIVERGLLSNITPCGMPLWSCSWDYLRSHEFYVGGVGGVIKQYDVRNASAHVAELSSAGDLSPVVSLVSTEHGLLSCQLNSCWLWALSANSRQWEKKSLPVEGPFMSLCYDSASHRVLVATRASGGERSKLAVCRLRDSSGLGDVLVDAEQSFAGSSRTSVMCRSAFVRAAGGGWVAAHSESDASLQLHGLDGARSMQLPAAEPALDVCAAQVSADTVLAALSDSRLRLYRAVATS